MVAAALHMLLLSLLFFASDGHTQDTNTLLLKVVNSIERLTGFYKASYQYMNLDGIYGLKIVEGLIQTILDEHNRGLHTSLSPVIVQRLGAILHDARWIGEQAIAAVRADDETYFQNLAYVISQPWTFFKHHRKINPAFRWDISVYNANKNVVLGEQESDKCMMEITLSDKIKGKASSQAQCNLTKGCAQTMTSRGLTDYGITHQLLWTALAEKAGCGKEMDMVLKMIGFNSTDDMQLEFCTNNYYEMLTVIHVFMSGTVSSNYQDMFMEQQFICPNLGFFEFMKKDYLEQILSWQLPTGCFGEIEENAQKDDVFQKLLPQADLSKLKDLSKISSLDMKKQQMQEQLKNLKSGDKILESMLKNLDGENDQVEKLHQQLQRLNQMRNVPINRAKHELNAEQAGAPHQQELWAGNAERFQVAHNQHLEGVPHMKVKDGRFQGAQSLDSTHAIYNPGNVDLFNRPPVAFPRALQPEILNRPIAGAPRRPRDDIHDVLLNEGPHRFQDVLAELPQRFPDQQADLEDSDGRVQGHLLQGLGDRHLDEDPRQVNRFDNVHYRHLDDRVEMQENVLDRLRGLDALAVQKALRDRAGPVPRYPKLQRRQIPGQGADEKYAFPSMQNRMNGILPRGRMLNAYETRSNSGRKLLVEKEMPGGCLAHKTGVACGALAMYLRYLIDPGPLNLFAPHEFYPETHNGFIGDLESHRQVMDFIKNHFQKNFNNENGKEASHNLLDLGEPGNENKEEDEGGEEDGDDDEEEEDEREDKEYRDDLYPDTDVEDKLQEERKVVRFGNAIHRIHDYNYARAHEKDQYEKEEEEENEDEENKDDDEEGAANFKPVKDGDGGKDTIVLAAGKATRHNEDTEYTYYDDVDKMEKRIIRRHKLPTMTHNGSQIRVHDRHNLFPQKKQQSSVVIADRSSSVVRQSEAPPSKYLVLILSAVSIMLLLFICRFMRKRRIHIKLGHRAFLKL